MKVSAFVLCILLSLRAASQTTVYIQPHFSAGCESDLFSLIPTGTGGYLQPEFNIIGWTSGGTPTIDRHILRFDALTDTTVIPAGAHISSAKLVLSGRSTSPEGNWGNSLYPGTPYGDLNNGWIYPLATPFNKYTVNWATQPAILHTDSVAIPVSYSRWNQNDTMDVTSLITYLIANGNNGLMFKLADESPYGERMWASCNEPDSTRHPLLMVTLCPNLISLSPHADTVSSGTDAKFFVTSPATGATYQWQEDPGTGFVNLPNVWPYSGVTTDTLTIHNTSIYLNATRYRCVVSAGPYCTDTTAGALLTVISGVGIDQLNGGQFSVSPNPATNVLNITGNDISAISVSDMLGRTVYTHSSNMAQKIVVNISSLPAGIYLVIVTDINGHKSVQKVTKQ
jgi:hypothetical protein